MAQLGTKWHSMKQPWGLARELHHDRDTQHEPAMHNTNGHDRKQPWGLARELHHDFHTNNMNQPCTTQHGTALHKVAQHEAAMRYCT
eukprot:1138629-Pelagomonas_calceolata.AAC.12